MSATPRGSVSGLSGQAPVRRRSVVHADATGTTEELLDELKHRMSIRRYEPGETIVQAGDIGNEMYFIGSGAVNIVVDEAAKKVFQMKNGFFGEVCLYRRDARRMASVVAAADTDICILTRHVIDDVLERYPKVKAEFVAESERREASARGGTSGTVEAVGADWMHKLGELIVGYDPSVQVAIRIKPSPGVSERERTIFKVGVNRLEAYEQGWSEREMKEKKKEFHFDFVYDETADTERIADEMGVHVCDAVFDGFNTCVMAYGATGTGKTFTMVEVTRCMLRQLFSRIDKLQTRKKNLAFDVKVSFLEVYCEELRDLLTRGNPEPPELAIRGSVKTAIFVDNLVKKQTRTLEELEYFFKAGLDYRTMSKTVNNEASSPAHTLFTVYVTRTQTYEDGSAESISSKMIFADLAGTQREYERRVGLDAVRHENDGSAERAEHERRNINVALQTLGVVIHKLACDSEPPYRQSKLSLLLAQSLGGNSKTYFVGTVDQTSLKNSLRTLRDAEFAMKIANHAVRAKLNGRHKLNTEFIEMDVNAPLRFDHVWAMVREANQLMEEIGSHLVFSLQPHSEVGAGRYPFGVRLTDLETTLSHLYEPDEFEIKLMEEKLWLERYFRRAEGHFVPGTDRTQEPFFVMPPMHLLDTLRIPLASLASDGVVDGVFSNRFTADSPPTPESLRTRYGADVTFKVSIAGAGAGSGARTPTAGPRRSQLTASADESRRRRQSTDAPVSSDLSGRARSRGSISGRTAAAALAEHMDAAVPLLVEIGELVNVNTEYDNGVYVSYELEGQVGASEQLLFAKRALVSGDSLCHSQTHELVVSDALLAGLTGAAGDPIEAYVEVWGHRERAFYSPKELRARLRRLTEQSNAVQAQLVAVQAQIRTLARAQAPLADQQVAYARMVEQFHALRLAGKRLLENESFGV